MGEEGSVGLILGQLGSRMSKLGSTVVMWGQGGSNKDKLGSERLCDGFYDMNVIWLGKQLWE